MVKELSAQEIFDRVAMHLAKQGKKAQHKDAFGVFNCVNCTEDGLRCAVGCLVPMEFYANGEFRIGGIEIISTLLEAEGIMANNRGTRELLVDLQLIHDNQKVSRWPQKLRGLAKRHGLMIHDWLKAA